MERSVEGAAQAQSSIVERRAAVKTLAEDRLRIIVRAAATQLQMVLLGMAARATLEMGTELGAGEAITEEEEPAQKGEAGQASLLAT